MWLSQPVQTPSRLLLLPWLSGKTTTLKTKWSLDGFTRGELKQRETSPLLIWKKGVMTWNNFHITYVSTTKRDKHNKMMLTRTRSPAKLPCHMYHLWLVSCLFLLSKDLVLLHWTLSWNYPKTPSHLPWYRFAFALFPSRELLNSHKGLQTATRQKPISLTQTLVYDYELHKPKKLWFSN